MQPAMDDPISAMRRLADMVARTEVSDVTSFVAAIIQADQR